MAAKNKISNNPIDLMKNWLSGLLGRNNTGPREQNAKEEQEAPGSSDDSMYFVGEKGEQSGIASDLQNAEKFTKGVIDKLKNNIPTPNVSGKKKDMQTESIPQPPAETNGDDEKVSNKLLGKILRIVVIIVLVFILIYIVVAIYRQVVRSGDIGFGNDQNGGVTTSPTPISFEPYKPSIYAKDPEILQIEEDVEVLDRELFRSNIRETQLTLPSLDFNINFDQ